MSTQQRTPYQTPGEEPAKISSHVIGFSDEQVTEILKATERILRSGHVILGEYTKEFEKAYAGLCERRYGVAVASDTAAFEILLKIIGVEGRHVLFPAVGFFSLLESVDNAGGKPWFMDCNLEAHLFPTAEQVETYILGCAQQTGEPPAALVLMHTGGLIARDSVEIVAVCRQYGVMVLEDAAHSCGALLNGYPAGSFGEASAFSLYATKPMQACEGGMIVTDDFDWMHEAKTYRNYGRIADFGRSVCIRHGYSWRLTEIQAAIGLSNLAHFGKNLFERVRVMNLYDNLLAEDDGIGEWVTKLPMSPGMKPNGYRYLLMLPEGTTAEQRMVFKQHVLKTAGVDLPGEVYELAAHRQPVYGDRFKGVEMPVADDFCARHVSLPVYPALSDDDCEYVFEAVKDGLRATIGAQS